MNLARGSLPRLFAAALLTPIVPFILLLASIVGWSVLRQQSMFLPTPEWRWVVSLWLAISGAYAIFGLGLRALKKTRLRYHVSWALALAAIPALIVFVEFIDLLMSAGNPPEVTEDGLVVVENPYGCYELFRRGTLSVYVTLALWSSAAAAVFKWMTYGFDRDTPASTGWKIAGCFYILALLFDFVGIFGQMSGAYPGFTDHLSKLCAYTIS